MADTELRRFTAFKALVLVAVMLVTGLACVLLPTVWAAVATFVALAIVSWFVDPWYLRKHPGVSRRRSYTFDVVVIVVFSIILVTMFLLPQSFWLSAARNSFHLPRFSP